MFLLHNPGRFASSSLMTSLDITTHAGLFVLIHFCSSLPGPATQGKDAACIHFVLGGIQFPLACSSCSLQRSRSLSKGEVASRSEKGMGGPARYIFYGYVWQIALIRVSGIHTHFIYLFKRAVIVLSISLLCVVNSTCYRATYVKAANVFILNK